MAKKGRTLGSIAAAFVGAAVGATAVVLSDKKNRQAFKKKVEDVVEEGGEKLEEVSKMVEDVVGGRGKKGAFKPKAAKKTVKKAIKSKKQKTKTRK